MHVQDPRAFIAHIPLFRDISPELLEQIAAQMRQRTLEAGEVLVRQGEPGDSLFLIIDGRFQAVLERESLEPRWLGDAGRGEIIGEMAVLTDEPRFCSVIARRRSYVLELGKSDFLRIMLKHPAELLTITRQIIRRAKKSVTSTPAQTIALVPLTPGVDLARFAASLSREIAPFHNSVHAVTPEDFHKRFGGTDRVGGLSPDLHEVVDWLQEIEERFALVIYLTEPEPSGWTRRCMAQADRILLVADAAASPSPGPIDALLEDREHQASRAPVELVLLHERADRAPNDTLAWLEPRPEVETHHHVAVDEPAHFGRLARLLADRGILLVLSGGGARGLSHIGVVRALQEAGIPIDFIGGASIGAVVGALFASGWDGQRIQEEMASYVTGGKSVQDFTFPMLSVFTARKGTQAIRELAQGLQIEDLWTNYFALSADLNTAEEVIHRRGPLWLAMRASASIPAAFPPVMSEDRCLVDGGLLNNFPLDVMARLARGKLVAVDASQRSPQRYDVYFPVAVSGWKVLGRKLNPFRRGRRAPSLLRVVSRSNEIASIRNSQQNLEQSAPAVLARAPVKGIGMLDFKKIDDIIERSYRYAMERVDEWKEALGV
jgi:predicted acylesterase/phospholipase RssA/CRP-like cAMP-binding protein